MLHTFLRTHRDQLIALCRAKVEKRRAPRPTEAELKHGIPQFLDQLLAALVSEMNSASVQPSSPSEIGATAAQHGNDLQRRGFTVDQVVHDYGDLCEAVTELARETNAGFTVEEFGTLTRCLDNAIAAAVTEYSREREQRLSDASDLASNQRLGVLAHELRNSLNTATLAIGAIKSGKIAFGGATGAVLDRSIAALRDLIDRSLAEVRLAVGIPVPRERVPLAEFVEELQVSAAMEANARGLELTVTLVEPGLAFDADRQILASAVSNLLNNAFKFTRPRGHVSLRAHAPADRILIEIEDECGGLHTKTIEDLFRPFEQQDADRSGLGLGLAISRRGIEANGGTLRARNIAGKGCVFTVDLPNPQHRV